MMVQIWASDLLPDAGHSQVLHSFWKFSPGTQLSSAAKHRDRSVLHNLKARTIGSPTFPSPPVLRDSRNFVQVGVGNGEDLRLHLALSLGCGRVLRLLFSFLHYSNADFLRAGEFGSFIIADAGIAGHFGQFPRFADLVWNRINIKWPIVYLPPSRSHLKPNLSLREWTLSAPLPRRGWSPKFPHLHVLPRSREQQWERMRIGISFWNF